MDEVFTLPHGSVTRNRLLPGRLRYASSKVVFFSQEQFPEEADPGALSAGNRPAAVGVSLSLWNRDGAIASVSVTVDNLPTKANFTYARKT